jgi:RNA polymerase sigma-70 factor, ECF subfamily
LIARGLRYLERAATGESITPYHVEAAIAACHAAAPDEATTDWHRLLRLYDDLLVLKPSPVAALNRAITLAMVAGPTVGIRELEQLEKYAAGVATPCCQRRSPGFGCWPASRCLAGTTT